MKYPISILSHKWSKVTITSVSAVSNKTKKLAVKFFPVSLRSLNRNSIVIIDNLKIII